MPQREVGIVFVLFHPDAAALEHLHSLRGQVRHLVVVDNSPAPDEGQHEQLRATGVVVIANRNEGGLGRAYNRGVSAAIDAGCELVFLFDQDSEVPADYVERMAAVTADVAGTAYLVGPRIYEVRAGAYMPDGAEPGDHADGLHDTIQLISSGSGVSAAAFRRLGEYREDFVIEWIDVEYFCRAGERGVARYVNPGLVLRQYQGRITRHGSMLTTNHAPARRYYLIRNGLWTVHRYWGLRVVVTGGIRLVLRELYIVLRAERQKGRKCLAVLAGVIDGVTGRFGPWQERRPRLHRLDAR